MTLLLYQLIYPLLAFAVLGRILWGGRGAALKEGAGELRERLGLPAPATLAPLTGGDGVLWIHAASVGEVLAAAPLVRALAAEAPARRILMTTSTVSGRERARTLAGVAAAVLAPMDLFPAVFAFMGRTRPQALILIETELWPMMLWAARRRGVRLGMANGRLTPRAAGRYRWVRGFMASVLGGFERAALQSEEDAVRFRSLGMPAESTAVVGNMKYDLPGPSEDEIGAVRERLAELGWQEDVIWTAASTRRGEEDIVVAAHRKAAKKISGLRLVLAPRHPERVGEAEAILRAQGVKFVRWSQLMPFQSDPECLLIDRIGVLAALFPASRAAFVGASLVPVGGHNLLEPALAGLPVLFGPHTGNIQEVADALRERGGGTVVNNAASLASALVRLLGDEAHRQAEAKAALTAARGFAGATARTLRHLSPLWDPKK